MMTIKTIIEQYLNLNKDRLYLKCVITFFTIWLFTTSPLRLIIKDTAFASSWIVGITPNFFAGITLVFWQTYGMSTRPFISFLCAVFVLIFSEFIQLFMSTQHADFEDIFASMMGSSLAAFFVFFWSKRQKQIAIKNESLLKSTNVD
jgi:hypothetical protein